MRIGIGYDVHKLVKGRSLILGGVNIPYEKGLLGHSDADVLTHAIIDALLGAANMGDIGRLFPDTDEAYKDSNSTLLLKNVCTLLAESGFTIGNIDATIIAQQPKLAGYIPAMEEALAEAMGAAPAINIKATTEEGLGFTGMGQGMAAQAICLLHKTERNGV